MPDSLSSCPFYGVRIIEFAPGELPSAGALITTEDGRCALITEAPSPCVLQLAGTRPDWLACARNPANTDDSYLLAITPIDPANTPETVAEKVRQAREIIGPVDSRAGGLIPGQDFPCAAPLVSFAALRKADPTPVLGALSEVKREDE